MSARHVIPSGGAFEVLAALVLALPVAAREDGRGAGTPVPETPVQVGGSPDLDACPTVATVAASDLSTPGEAAVLTAPDRADDVLDRVPTGHLVRLCEDRGEWVGIVYRAGEGAGDCGVSSPSVEERAYDGPCRSGWMRASRLAVAAG